MNEFYSPRRENKNTNETAYAEPADELNIVVDDNDTGAAFCSKCGNRLDAGDAFCSRCGAKTFGSSQSRTQQQYSQPTAQAQTQTAQQPQNVYNYNYNYSTTTTTNTSANVNSGNVNSYAYGHGKLKDKRVSLILCLLFGIFGTKPFIAMQANGNALRQEMRARYSQVCFISVPADFSASAGWSIL